jgi:acetyl-CoA acetyltransferase
MTSAVDEAAFGSGNGGRAVAGDIVISGVGETEYSKSSGRSELRLGLDATVAACRDAGVDPRDIDGFIGYPFGITAEDISSNLGVRELGFTSGVSMGGASAVASLRLAGLAIASGAAHHVLVVRARNGYSGSRIGERPSQLPSQHLRRELEHPYGWRVPAQRYAMICRRYIHEYGLSREQLGAVAVTMRVHAQLNPHAQMYGRPLTMDDYLAGRLIADPYTFYDCSLETDGACAILVSDAALATTRDWCARVLAVAEGHPDSPDDLTNRPDLLAIGLDHAADNAWNRAGMGPSDMNAAMIYDCFTFELLHQLEAAGFTAEGESGAFVAAGQIALGGSLPVNTHGGLLSEGHLSGLNHVLEAVRQLRGECGPRQVGNARRIAVTGWGDLGDGSLAVLDRARSSR